MGILIGSGEGELPLESRVTEGELRSFESHGAARVSCSLVVVAASPRQAEAMWMFQCR